MPITDPYVKTKMKVKGSSRENLSATENSLGNTAPYLPNDISYPDLRIFNEQRRSSDSNRSAATSSNKTLMIEELVGQLKVENQIKRGAENMLQVLDEQKQLLVKEHDLKHIERRQRQVESQLDASSTKISILKEQLEDLGLSSKYQMFTDSLFTSLLTKMRNIFGFRLVGLG